jgi:trimethylamine---corrinoid protein Co-methyltransferase
MRRGALNGGELRAAADIRFLSHDAMRQIHLATLELLERTGVWVELDEALDIYADGRCWVDRDTHNLRIFPQLVEDALASTPPTLMAYADRDPANDHPVGGGRTSFTNFSVGLQMNDLESGERRPAVLGDCADIAKIVDASDALDFVIIPMAPSDVAPGMQMVSAYAACVANTTKSVSPTYEQPYELAAMVEIAKAVAGGEEAYLKRPSLNGFVSPVSPLKLPAGPMACVIWACRNGLMANGALSMPMAGATAPPSLAAALVIQNAELLSVLVLQHLIRPGMGFFYGSSGTAMDLQWGTCPVGTPEAALVNAGTAAMAKFYDIPSVTGGL